MPTPRILYLDAYDSFSNNIICLLQDQLQAKVESIKIDDPRFVLNDDAFVHFLDGFDAIVAGPGPGHPGNPQDVGLIRKLWHMPDDRMLPVLGICLGFQSLCLAHGASVERLEEPRHGLVTPVTHCGSDVFTGSGEVLATQYHSLHVDLADDRDDDRGPWKACKDILPLAWDLSDDNNGSILMAARHAQKPYWGVQYHPESVCTNGDGRRLIQAWWKQACEWMGLDITLSGGGLPHPESQDRVDSGRTSEDFQVGKVYWAELPLPKHIDVVHLTGLLRQNCEGREPLVLESGTRIGKPVSPETGRFSIIGIQNATSTHICYSTSTHQLRATANARTLIDCDASIQDVFNYLEHFTADHKAVGGPEEVPFWGGLVGYISYEAGLESINVTPAEIEPDHPDVWFVFVERSVVADHAKGRLYVQSIADEAWVASTVNRLKVFDSSLNSPPGTPISDACIVSEPEQEIYCAKVRACQSQLRAGESYELCLTDTTHVQTSADAWSLYSRLRDLNPAPFGAYLSLSSASASLDIASSSPERFLSWSREGQCEFRPIKGTVKKAAGVSRKEAEAVLHSPKEQAENLMIVDLIRHDLSGVRGVTNVSVPKLMTIEEYATVYQLVSVITGHSSNPISVLSASLPPGSMTGAPKKRSCQLLRGIEGEAHARGVYSGVIGYFDVGGGGDFSVAIRTAFKWGDEGCWRVGAGGAVTVLSEAEAEWEEMRTKRESALRAFGVVG